MSDRYNIKKLCVGVETIDDLIRIQNLRFTTQGYSCAYTTQCPKKADEIIEKGSLYWVIKGKITARQKIIAFKGYVDDGGRKRTIIVLDKNVVETERFPHRPFQGWRYLSVKDAPKDVDQSNYKDISSDVLAEMQDLGIL